METTGQRYVYSGSSDGNVHIYDLVTGDTAGILRKQHGPIRNDPWGHQRSGGSPCRDISWHPYLPVMASTEFNGNVNVWTIQNISAEELKVQERKAKEEEERLRREQAEEDGLEDDEDEYVVVQGPGGRIFRMPRSVLTQLMRRNHEEEEAEEDQPDSDGGQVTDEAEQGWDDDEEEEESEQPSQSMQVD